ncbi:hypothetical protein [Flavobacterium pedocola]
MKKHALQQQKANFDKSNTYNGFNSCKMTNSIVFTSFFNTVQSSIDEGTFAKLTFTKTIGKPELVNIYVRTVIADDTLKLAVTFKIYEEGLKEVEKIITLEEMEAELTPYINNPFMWVLLFTTEADITMKLNKKRIANISEQPPTFKNPDIALTEFRNK